MKQIEKYARLVLPLLLAVTAWLFFGVFYRWHLLYIEGNQLFLWTADYARETIAHLGGLGDYVTRFLVQFYHLPLLGGAIVALLLVALQQGVQRVMQRVAKSDALWPLSYVPSVAYWVLLCNDDFTLVGLVALAASMWTAVGISRIKNNWTRATVALVGLVALWLAVGGAAVVAWVAVVAIEVAATRDWRTLVAAVLAAVAVAVMWNLRLWYQSDEGMVTGGLYFRYVDIPLDVFYKLWAATAAVLVVPALVKRWVREWINVVVAVAVVGVAVSVLSKHYDSSSEDTMAYYYLAHNGKWNEVIERASKHDPQTRPAMICLNLSLVMSGQSGERLFDFPQYGPAGLFMTYDEDLIFCGEVLYHLGFVNEAQRYAYEMMATNPDHQRSAFSVTRLAETNMVAERDEVARKYLNTLKHTLFYRSWAENLLELMDTPKAVDEHRLYGKLRRNQPAENFSFFSDKFDKMLEEMVDQRPKNREAYEYLMAFYLLYKDVDSFAERLIIPTKGLPRVYEEAFAMVCRINHVNPATLPANLNRATFERLERYIHAYNMSGNNPEVMNKDWGRSYWFYTNFIRF
ncbi:MAG: hypothetical protein IKB14_05880 [Rikenellaceae bacterium]|nr:hypothetical protein [Rikenellaceae bacterium]